MTNYELELGMGIDGNNTLTTIAENIDEIYAANINILRIDPYLYQDAAWLANVKAAIIAALVKYPDLKFIFGVSSPDGYGAEYTLTAANWNDFRLAVLDAAQWAQDNGVWMFQIANEEELHIDGTTLTEEQFRINLRALATEVKAIFTRGKINYAFGGGAAQLNAWYAEGIGDIDYLCLNAYWGGYVFNDWWKSMCLSIKTKFPNNSFITEFSLCTYCLSTYSTDENVQLNALIEMIKHIKNLGFEKAVYFNYRSNCYGAKNVDGTFKKIWEVLKIQNDWKKRKTAGTSMIRGVSNGKHNR